MAKRRTKPKKRIAKKRVLRKHVAKKSLKKKTAKRVVRLHALGRRDKFMPSTLPWEKSKQEWKNDWDDDFADFESDSGSGEY